MAAITKYWNLGQKSPWNRINKDSNINLLKSEKYHGTHFQSADELIDKIGEYIKCDNIKWLKIKLKGLSPTEYRNQALHAEQLINN
nr:IS3 family transposase [Providencia sneebia]